MKKYLIWFPMLLSLFFLIGCDINYQCKIDTKIDPRIYVIGNDEKAIVILEYNLGPIYMLDSLKDITPVDAFFFRKKYGEFKEIKLTATVDSAGLSDKGPYYEFDGKSFKGTERLYIKDLFEYRLEMPELKWTIYNEEEFENGAPLSILKGIDIEQEKEEIPKQETDSRGKL